MSIAGSSARAAVGLGLLLSAAGAGAQTPRESIYAACAQMTDDRERLACFDRTYASETAVIAERAETERRVEAEAFGLTPKQLREREDRAKANPLPVTSSALASAAVPVGAPAPAPSSPPVAATAAADTANDTKVISVVAEVLTDGLGNHVIILENGQMWRSTSNKSFRGRVKAGWKAEINKIWSGGFRMTFADKTGFLGVTRMR
ncbi:hypothetical protein C0V72_02670 [Porphyrobacter sp. TH134]|uniref:hypothetical protein n=1 Tax=Porphyrobacter sp. TH134 TaxID=2067450 RepID=UPI000C7E79FE|nr:hypothetical protein [Porphyrobacter sp. TH134]PLK25213.1 hypothetical protein C0V72_02670 [Porphyrobacter sp. TH134]